MYCLEKSKWHTLHISTSLSFPELWRFLVINNPKERILIAKMKRPFMIPFVLAITLPSNKMKFFIS